MKLTFSSKPLSPLYLKIPVIHADCTSVAVMGMKGIRPEKAQTQPANEKE